MTDFISAAYFAQDLERLGELMEEESEEVCGSTKEELERLLYNRNDNWLRQMPAIMADKPTFFAVGAGHLTGDRGVLEGLRKAGYKVESVR